MKLFADISDETHIELLARAIHGEASSSEIFRKIFVENFTTVIVFVAGLLIALIIFLTCIVMLVYRWISPDEDPPKNTKIWTASVVLVVCGTITLICLVLIRVSTNAISDGVKNLPEQAKRSANAAEEFVTGLGAHLRCQFKKERDRLSEEVDEASRTVNRKMNNLQESLKNLKKRQKSVRSMLDVLRGDLHDLLNIGNAKSRPIHELAGQIFIFVTHSS
ncbi:hypothetical protein Y032_0002g896 [Ancylostoma ceylanicum]|nr:hypothetical protein Y032_0002g896 [Ancylostoma ceylanicum]